MLEEQTFFESEAARITSSRIVIGSQTFATRNVGSVSVQEKPRKTTAIVVCALLALIIYGLTQQPVIPAMFAAVSVYLFVATRPTYKLIMMAGGGEVVALVSHDPQEIRQLHDAVAQAISVR
jgi:hypothetical protein